MLKLLRQYNQWILAVGGTLLLIAFLMPSAIQNCAHQSAVGGATWATYGEGQKLTGADLERARRELAMIDLLRDPNPSRDPIARVGASKDPAHWWMLTHEAQLAGLIGGEGRGEAVLAAMAARSATAENPITSQDILRNIMRATGGNREFVLETTAKWRGVLDLLSLCESVDRISDKRLEQFMAKAVLGMSGDIVVLDARANAAIPGASPDSPSLDGKLGEQLKKYADKAAPSEIGKDSFGYRLPDRVRLEWLGISKSVVQETIQNSPDLQSLALKKRFAQDPAKYGADPATNPAFTAYESAVRSKTVEELTKSRLEEISKFASDQLGLSQRALKRKNNYFVLPDDWTKQMPSMNALATTIASEFGIPAPAVGTSGDQPITLEAVAALPGIGRATTQKFGQSMRTQQLVAGAKELTNPNAVAPIQALVASPAMVDDRGDVYFFRIMEALPSAPATELASIRDRVLSDVQSVERFSWLEANQDAIAKEAIADGLRTVAGKYAAKTEFVRELRQFNSQFIAYGFRMGSPIPGLGADPKTLAALVEKASALPLTSDLSKVPAAERTFVVASPDKLSLVVFQVSELLPLSRESMDGLRATPEVARAARDDSVSVDLSKVFSFDAVAHRIGFKRLNEEKLADGEHGGDSKAPAAATTAATTPST